MNTTKAYFDHEKLVESQRQTESKIMSKIMSKTIVLHYASVLFTRRP